MCTLIVSVGQYPSLLLVSANRDELRERPASPPSHWEREDFVAPRDVEAGGTWLGLTRSGMFVGVTNRYPSQKHAGRESRGQLVVEALRARSPRALHAALQSLRVDRFNTFHLLYADHESAFVAWSDDTRIHHRELGRGLHVVTERSLGGDDQGREDIVRAAWPTLETEGGVPTPRALQRLLSTGVPGGVCVDLPEFNYGTRSSLVLYAKPDVTQSRWFWADGRPDQTPYVENPALMASLAG